MSTPLIIAAHGTRDAEGEAVCKALTERVGRILDGVDVSVGFVELSEPGIPRALADAVKRTGSRSAVVVPLMLGTGGHVRVDIPEFIQEALDEVPHASVRYARHLGPDPRLVGAVRERMAAARGDWQAADTTLVFLGRGALVPEANADHVRLARMHYEEGGWRDVEHCFIQVTQPSLPEGLDRAYANGARQILVMGHWLFPGVLRTWTHQQSSEWAARHPDAEVRIAEVIGDCDELAQVVIERYREMLPEESGEGSPAYPAGLLLRDRDVVVVGGGCVASRRVPALIEAGAKVRLIAPEATDRLAGFAETGALEWVRRDYADGDLAGAWYVMAATPDPEVNARVGAEAEANHTFCVRADDGFAGSAWTPASLDMGGVSIAVLGNRDPKRTTAIRQAIFRAPTVREAVFGS